MYVRTLCVAALLLLVAACSDVFGPKEDLAVATLHLSVGDTALVQGQSLTLLTTARNAAGNVLSSPGVTLTSRHPSVASVTEGGLVTAHAPGVTYVVASAGTVSDSARVTVLDVTVATLELLSPADTAMVEGETHQIRFVARNAAGDSIAKPAVTFVSRDPLSASVSPTGRITALAEGASWIVVSAAGHTDSMRVTASFADPAGRVAFRTSAPHALVGRLHETFGIHSTNIARDSDDAFAIAADNWSAGLSFLLGLQGPPEVGSRTLTSFDLTTYQGGHPPGDVAAIAVLTAAGMYGFASVSGEAVVERVVTPAGGSPGEVSGRLTMRAAVFVPTSMGGWVANGDTLDAVARFRVNYFEDRYGEVSFTLSGGPVERDTTVAAEAFNWFAGRVLGWFQEFGPEGMLSTLINLGTVSGEGSFSLESFDPIQEDPYGEKPVVVLEWFDAAAGWTYHVAFPTGGTVEITSLTTPTASSFGEIRFTVNAALEYWNASPGSGLTPGSDATQLAATVHVPLVPIALGGAPSLEGRSGRSDALGCGLDPRRSRAACVEASPRPGGTLRERLEEVRAQR